MQESPDKSHGGSELDAAAPGPLAPESPRQPGAPALPSVVVTNPSISESSTDKPETKNQKKGRFQVTVVPATPQPVKPVRDDSNSDISADGAAVGAQPTEKATAGVPAVGQPVQSPTTVGPSPELPLGSPARHQPPATYAGMAARTAPSAPPAVTVVPQAPVSSNLATQPAATAAPRTVAAGPQLAPAPKRKPTEEYHVTGRFKVQRDKVSIADSPFLDCPRLFLFCVCTRGCCLGPLRCVHARLKF